jgi:hypothetical protein
MCDKKKFDVEGLTFYPRKEDMTTWFLEDEGRAPRMDVGARQAGINKLARQKKSSSTAGSNAGKPCKFRVQCPVCPMEGGDTMYAFVQKRDKKTMCRAGHPIDCSGGCK